jgi:hypothetical protein
MALDKVHESSKLGMQIQVGHGERVDCPHTDTNGELKKLSTNTNNSTDIHFIRRMTQIVTLSS